MDFALLSSWRAAAGVDTMLSWLLTLRHIPVSEGAPQKAKLFSIQHVSQGRHAQYQRQTYEQILTAC